MNKVMIVEDEQDLRDIINIIIQNEGYETEVAHDGEEFLEKIDSFQPDLVTLDVMMPGLTTREIFERLKEKTSHPKIILLTVIRYSEEEKEQIMQMGNVVDYITKPFDSNEFIKRIKYHLEKQEAE